MFKYSLMNPDFLQKELADSETLLAEMEMFARETQIEISDIIDIFIALDVAQPNRETYTLDKTEVQKIVRLLTRIQIKSYAFTSPRRVMISHYKQLLEDRRYRIATRLAQLFA